MNKFTRAFETLTQCLTSNKFCNFLKHFPDNSKQYIIGDNGKYGKAKENMYAFPIEWHSFISTTVFFEYDLIQLQDLVKKQNLEAIKNDIMELINEN